MSEPTVPTKKELETLIADRKNDLAHQSPELVPPWTGNRSEAEWRHIRERERKIRRMTHRLDRAKQQLDHDFDMNS